MPIILALAKTLPPRGSRLKFVRLWIYRFIEVDEDLIKPSGAAHDASGEHSCYQSCLQFLKALLRKSVAALCKILGKQPRLRKINS
ncbi:hypothetical protein SLEP1_g43191 [Rubroshorea leprosula]|uniref:Uncharacterized protein n=1 Tax=Rubroshorea leprosula TaxID=152421 RepID=A0AAV5LC71_9ROSI|nr:hypothetical protein SLEP1_g43191 [Rubroshorea leprosula]